MLPPAKLDHPNRRYFDGVITILGQPSDMSPCGARGHRVMITPEAGREAMPSLLGMAVGFKAGYDGHDARMKCGIITDATIVGDEMRVTGYIFDHDFPEVSAEIRVLDMGMSYEVCDLYIEDLTATIWVISKLTFTGAAILLRRKASYHRTSIRLSTPRPFEMGYVKPAGEAPLVLSMQGEKDSPSELQSNARRAERVIDEDLLPGLVPVAVEASLDRLVDVLREMQPLADVGARDEEIERQRRVGGIVHGAAHDPAGSALEGDEEKVIPPRLSI